MGGGSVDFGKTGVMRACVLVLVGLAVCACLLSPAQVCADGIQPPPIKNTGSVGDSTIVPVDTTSVTASSSTTDLPVLELVLFILGVL